MADLEATLAQLAIFEHLRPDEVARIARRFEAIDLGEEDRKEWTDAILVVVYEGTVDLDVKSESGTLTGRMTEGDRHGTFALLTGIAKPCVVRAVEHARI